MTDKNAIINAAHKFASKGNIDKAISEWEKLLENGKDGNVQNTIGDLYLKKEAQTEAVAAFTKAAEIFRKDGFYPKAIAIYKKILNLLPTNVESIIALAKLNATKGLNANAADYYFKAAEVFHRSGYAEKATQAVEKILQLSTVDMTTRIRIADWYIKAGMKPRAANEYAAIASSYLNNDDTANAEKFFSKATELDPDNISSLIGLGKFAEKTGDIELAFKHLDDAMSRDPNSKETLLAYSELALRNNRIDDAKKSLLKLIGKNPSNEYPRKLLGNLYLDENKPEKAWEQLLPCIDSAINDKNWADAIEILNKFRELHPIPVRERIIDIYTSADDSENLSKEIKELANLHERQGSHDDALRLYKMLLESDPDNTEAADRIKELGAAAELPVAEPAAEPAPETAIEKPLQTEEAAKKDPPLPEALIEKRVEAEFYAKQGMNEEAANIYKEILQTIPDNAEIKKRLEALQSASGQPEELVVKKMYDAEAVTKDELDTSSAAEDLQSIFDEFSQNEDYEARYRAGLEHKQKGHQDAAIKEFRIAAQDPEKKLISKSMIALCYMEKGTYADAVTEFTQVIEAMSSNDASYLRIKYELAGAYKNNGNETRALELYSEIREQDPEFRNVSDKIEDLRPTAPKPATDESKPKKKRSRISYI